MIYISPGSLVVHLETASSLTNSVIRISKMYLRELSTEELKIYHIQF